MVRRELQSTHRMRKAIPMSVSKSKRKAEKPPAVPFKWPRKARFDAENKPKSKWSFERDLFSSPIRITKPVMRRLLSESLASGVPIERLVNVGLEKTMDMLADQGGFAGFFGELRLDRVEKN